MQSNSIQSYDQGRFNTLPDDILLSILERVDMRTVLRTSVLSTRWKHLPLLLSDVDLDVDEFIHQNSSMSAHEAMAVLIKLMSSLFGSPQNESIIKKLNLSFYLLTDLETSLKFLFNIGELVCNAIDSGKVKSVELTITTEKRRFKLTDLMSGASNIWIEYEGKELRTALNKITKLLLHGIYVKFNLLWTLVLLESAPSVKIFGVKVWNHSCDQDTVDREIFSERRNDLWDVAQLDSSVHYNQLEKLNFGGFNPTIKEHLDLVRTVIERAPKLKSVFLEDREPCKGCEAMDNPIYPSTISMFPQNEDEKSTVAKQLKAGTSRPDQGRFDQLPDDILLSILERVDMRTVLRTSVLSTRWKHLPLLLSDVDLDVDEFIHQNSSMSADEAMAVLIKLICLFGSPQSESIIKKLSLSFCLLTDSVTSLTYLFNISELVCNAVDSGKVKSLELAITTEKRSIDYTTSDMLLHAKSLVDFFKTSSSLSCCLTKLLLCTARFSEQDLHQLIISCDQLQHLTLYYCELRDSSTLKLDMPNSKLRFVELNSCYVKTVEFLCLPKLEQLYCDSWRLSGAPLSFGVVPCLEELRLVCATSRIQSGFKLTDLLHGTANVQDIALDFQGEVVWNHACDEGTENRKQLSERRNDLWDAAQLDGSIHYLQLERLEFGGFNQIIREHLDFIRAVIERAPNLKSVILEDRDPCEDCEAMDNPIYPSISMFPQNNDEKSTIVKQLKAGMNRPVEIIFC
uniref:F-box domain-containing protein n=1 Tax=Oryza meridionalis TaxID=40149 RepID=A0A0E0CWW2_9ORYZ